MQNYHIHICNDEIIIIKMYQHIHVKTKYLHVMRGMIII